MTKSYTIIRRFLFELVGMTSPDRNYGEVINLSLHHNLYTQTNHVCDFIILNYTSMTHSVRIYDGTVAFYRDLTRITVSDIKSEWI